MWGIKEPKTVKSIIAGLQDMIDSLQTPGPQERL